MTESCATLGGSGSVGRGGGGGVVVRVTNGKLIEKDLRSHSGEPMLNGTFEASNDVIEFD